MIDVNSSFGRWTIFDPSAGAAPGGSQDGDGSASSGVHQELGRPGRLPHSGTQDAACTATRPSSSSRPTPRACRPVCVPTMSGRYVGARRGYVRKSWATACRKAGCPGMLRHDFRRTAVRDVGSAGVPRSVVRKITGYKTQSVYRRYAIVNDADLQEAVRWLTCITTGITARPDVAPGL